MILNSPYISGSLTVTGNATIQGQLTVTGSLSGTASLASNALLLQGTGSTGFATTASLLAVSSSQQQISASLLSLTASYNALSSSYTALSASYNVASSSFSTRITSDSSSLSSRTTQIENVYATTGSNSFTGVQNFSNTCTPNSFTAGASLYTAGGLRVTQDAYFSSSVYIKGNVTVYGTQSVAYISSSQLDIGTNIITVNTATPSIRYGGLSVFDSGSTGLTGSILWDSELNRWIYSNASGSGGGATYGGGMFISGPRNSQGIGCEQGTTACMLLVGQGGDHLTSSMVYHSSTVTCVPNTLIGSVGCFSSNLKALSALLQSTDTAAVVDVLTLYNPSSTSSGVRQKYQNGYGDLAAIKVSQRDNGTLADDGQIEFQVASNSVLDTKLTILNTGVATFSGNVNVYDASSRGLTISNSSGAITFSNNWGKTTFTSPSAQDIEFNDDAGVKRLFLKNGGNVGIGTCTAGAKLEIEAGRNCTLLRLTATSGENWDIKNTNTVGSTDVLSIGAAGATANLNLKDDGSVGIGTCSPSGLFQVGVANSGIYFDTSLQYTPKIIAAGTISDIQIQSVGNGGNVYLNAPGTTSLIGMSVNGTERMRISSAGNVGIGTTCFYNGANFVVSAGSGTASSPYMGIFNCTASPTNDASVRLDLGFLGGASNYVATGGCLGFINFMGQGNDAGYGGASIITVTSCGGNTCRFNHAIDMVFTAKPTGQTGALERMRITSGGTIFNKQWFGATLLGGYSLIGTIGPGNVGNRYLHARINTIGSMMVWIKIFGYSYAGGILEGIGGGYVDGSTGTIAQNFNNGSIPIIHQNAGYIEVVVDTVGTGTTNRWGSISFIGGTDTIATVQPLEIMTWSWTSTTTRVY